MVCPPVFRRLVSLVVLAALFTASTLGSLLHDHSHGDGHVCRHEAALGHADHDHQHVCGDHHDDAGDDEHATGAESDGRRHREPLHDDDCPVCRFAAERWLNVKIQPASTGHELSIRLADAGPLVALAGQSGLARSRAPPRFG